MNSTRSWLLFSLIGNLCFVAVLTSQLSTRSKAGEQAPSLKRERRNNSTGNGVVAQEWTTLSAGGLHELHSRLKDANYPAPVIRAILASLISEQFAEKRRALLASRSNQPFWKNPAAGSFEFDTRTALRELSRQRAQMLEELLGHSAASDSGETYGVGAGVVPAHKMPALQSIFSDYAELRSLVRAQMGGVMLQQDREKLALLDREQDADIAQLLSPSERRELALRTSRTAVELRNSLGIFSPTEDEFRRIFDLREAFDRRDGGNEAAGEHRRLAEHTLQAELQATLGAARYADYQLATDPVSQMSNRVLARFGLPIQAAHDAKAVQVDISQRVRAIQSDRSMAPAQASALIKSLSQEADAKLASILGSAAFDAYKEVNRGGWMRDLQPRSTPRGPTTGPAPSVRSGP